MLLQFGHGDEAVEDRKAPPQKRRRRSFNLATAMKPWKTCNRLGVIWPMAVLQFGHGDEAVEDSAS